MQDAQLFNCVDSGLNIQFLIEYSDFQIFSWNIYE